MSEISRVGQFAINREAIEKIKKWLMETLDEEDLNVPINIGNLARKTRQVEHITNRGNQPYFQQHILEPLEKEGYCRINENERTVVFLKVF